MFLIWQFWLVYSTMQGLGGHTAVGVENCHNHPYNAVGMNMHLLSQLAAKTHQIQSWSSCFLQNFQGG